MTRHDGRREICEATARRPAGWRARIGPLVVILALGLALSACDHCGDFFWQKQPGACKGGPAPN